MKYLGILCALLASACVADTPDDISSAEALLVDDTPGAVGVLAFVNDSATTLELLDVDVKLDARAARGLIEGRPFSSIEDIDAVPYVGPTAMNRLLAFATNLGYTPSGNDVLGVYDGVTFTVNQAEEVLTLVNGVSDGVLEHEVGLDPRAVNSIIEGRPFESVGQLAEAYWVGKSMLERMLDYLVPNTSERADCMGNGHCQAGWSCTGIPFDGSSDFGRCFPTANIPGDGMDCSADSDCGAGLICNGVTLGFGLCMPWWMRDSLENTTQRFIGASTPQPVATSVVVRGQASVPMDIIVSVDLAHESPENLRLVLSDPQGSEAVLWDGPNESGPMPTMFNAQGEISRDDNVNGQWLLRIWNDGGSGVGNLHGWTLDISSRWD